MICINNNIYFPLNENGIFVVFTFSEYTCYFLNIVNKNECKLVFQLLSKVELFVNKMFEKDHRNILIHQIIFLSVTSI